MSTRLSPTLPALLLFLTLAATPSLPAGAQTGTITGTATYRERVALTSNAVFEATLEDVSRADAAAVVIARARRSNPGQVPISFTITYDRDRIDPRRSYAVRARIHEGSRLRFVSDQAHPVLTRGHGSQVQIRMRSATGGEDGAGRTGTGGSALGRLPATFTGVVPCPDCAGIRYQINFLPGDAYMQRTTHLRKGSDVSTYALGSWSVDRDIVSLDPGTRELDRWSVVGTRTLRQLDRSGRPVTGDDTYEIARAGALEPMRPRLRMSGMFRYMADAARFRECRTGLEWPVVMGAEYFALERAYTERRSEPGAELLVSVDGRIEQVERMEGGGKEDALVVERFHRADPGQRCEEGPSGSGPGLASNRWVPVRIDGRSLQISPNEREPWIHFEARDRTVTGSGGCNRFTGTYEAGTSTLRLGPLAATKMACVSMETENAFFRVLDRARRYRVRGRMLDLMDDRDRVLAQLEERNL